MQGEVTGTGKGGVRGPFMGGRLGRPEEATMALRPPPGELTLAHARPEPRADMLEPVTPSGCTRLSCRTLCQHPRCAGSVARCGCEVAALESDKRSLRSSVWSATPGVRLEPVTEGRARRDVRREHCAIRPCRCRAQHRNQLCTLERRRYNGIDDYSVHFWPTLTSFVRPLLVRPRLHLRTRQRKSALTP